MHMVFFIAKFRKQKEGRLGILPSKPFTTKTADLSP